jgi:hypothetical protein
MKPVWPCKCKADNKRNMSLYGKKDTSDNIKDGIVDRFLNTQDSDIL